MVKVIMAILIFTFLRKFFRFSINGSTNRDSFNRFSNKNSVNQSDIQDADFEELD